MAGLPSISSTSARYEVEIYFLYSPMADNLSQDSLLATPLILDLTILAEFLTRVQYRKVGHQEDFSPLYSVLSLLSYMLKAPLVKPGMTPS